MKDTSIVAQIGDVIEEIWANMCDTTNTICELTAKHGMSAIDGLSNPTIDDMLSITERLDKHCDTVLSIISQSAKEYVDTRLLWNARQRFYHFRNMVLAYKDNNVAEFLAARDLLMSEANF